MGHGKQTRTQATMLAKVRQLYTHENHKWIQGMANGGFLVTDQKTGKQRSWPGITTPLQAKFYPHDPQDPWERGRLGITRRRTVTPVAARLPGEETASECASNGAKHGDLVHRQMEHWANCVKTFGFDDGTSVFLREHPQHLVSKRLDPCTLRIMAQFEEWGWLPVDSERQLWDPTLHLATRIDFVVVEKSTNKMIFIELKTSGSLEEYGELNSDPYMKAPLGEVRCSPENIHQLQLLTGMLMARKRYKGMVPDDGFVVRAHTKTKKVKRHGLPPWARDAENQRSVYKALKPRQPS